MLKKEGEAPDVLELPGDPTYVHKHVNKSAYEEPSEKIRAWVISE